MSELSRKQRIYPWLIVLGCGLWAGGSIGFLTIDAGNFYVPVSRDLGVAESTIGFYMTFVSLGEVIGFLIAGRTIPKMKLQVHMTIICAIEAFACIAMATYTQVYMWYVSGLIIGVCMGFNTSIGLAIVLNNWFAKKMGLAFGLAWGINSIIAAIMSPVITSVISAAGWRVGYVVLGVGSLILMCGSSIFIMRLKPEEIGLKPYGYDPSQGTVSEEASDGVEFRTAAKSPAFILLVVAMIIIAGTTVTNQLFPSYAVAVGYGAGIGGMLTLVAMTCDIGWDPLIGIAADKLGADRGVILWCGVTIVSFVCLSIGANILPLAFIGAGLNITMYACYGTGMAMLTRMLFGSKDYAKLYSLVMSLGYLGGSVGVPLLTGIYEATGTYNSVWLFCGICDVLIILCVTFATRFSKRLPRSSGQAGAEQKVETTAEVQVA